MRHTAVNIFPSLCFTEWRATERSLPLLIKDVKAVTLLGAITNTFNLSAWDAEAGGAQ